MTPTINKYTPAIIISVLSLIVGFCIGTFLTTNIQPECNQLKYFTNNITNISQSSFHIRVIVAYRLIKNNTYEICAVKGFDDNNKPFDFTKTNWHWTGTIDKAHIHP